jgi:hypothetical protein
VASWAPGGGRVPFSQGRAIGCTVSLLPAYFDQQAPPFDRPHAIAGAQLLNVIESVLSGMARAIIHNSDYGSVGDAQAAMTRYFEERNAAFLAAPRREGRAI